MQQNGLIIFLPGVLFSILAEGSSNKGALTAAYNQSSKVPCIKHLSFKFTYIKRILNISFTPSFIGEDYTVLLHAIGFYLLPKHTINNAKPVESCSFDIVEDLDVDIEISCAVGEEFKENLSVLDAYKTEELDCHSWNVNIYLSAIPNRQGINVQFSPAQKKYELCFKNYTVELFRFDEKCQYEDTSLNKVKEAIYNGTDVTVTFEDLSPGNYCAAVTAKHENCFDGTCGKIITSKVELPEIAIPIPVHVKKDKVNLTVIIAPLCLLVIMVAIGIIGARRIKNCLTYQLHDVESSYGQAFKYISEHLGNTVGNEETVIVSILHARCTELQSEVALAIYDFLKDCCNVHPVIAENNPELFVDPTAWIRENFNYKQLLNEKVIHKVLILETDAAVRLYESFKTPGEGHRVTLRYHSYSHLNDIFLRGLVEILSNPEFCGIDHHHIVVVCFPYCTNALSCFEQKRLYLPHQTVELYNSLWNKKSLLYNEEKLKNKWKESEIYKRLLETIEKMKSYVSENPNYLDHYIFEHTETVCIP